jgi:AcrR family transcriptional regulator
MGSGEMNRVESRTARKRRAIMSAATDLFLQKGYLGTSVDEIAAAAGVSKQTVYKQFGDKQRLFSDIVVATINAVGEPFFTEIEGLEEAQDLEAHLTQVAHRLVAVVRDPQLLRLRRLVIGEAGRFPELGRAYYQGAPGRTVETLVSRFHALERRGLLHLDDARLAAQNFIWLVLSIPLNRAMLSGEERFEDAELRRYADEAVRVFLAAYG